MTEQEKAEMGERHKALFPHFDGSIQFAVFNCRDSHCRAARDAVLKKFGKKGMDEVRAKTKTGIMQIFHTPPTPVTLLYAETVGAKADAYHTRREKREASAKP